MTLLQLCWGNLRRPVARVGPRGYDRRRHRGVSRPSHAQLSTYRKESLVIENPIKWPSGYRCAVNFSFDMDAESLLHIYFRDTAHNRVAMASRLRYGPEVAVPRI